MKKVLVVFPSVENGNVHTSTVHIVHEPNNTGLHFISYNGSFISLYVSFFSSYLIKLPFNE